MNPVFSYRMHQGALQVALRGRAPDYRGVIEVAKLVWVYRREVESLNSWLVKQQRVSEWLALKEWWQCQTPEEWEACRRMFGATLTRALDRWRQTERYVTNKAKYQKKIS